MKRERPVRANFMGREIAPCYNFVSYILLSVKMIYSSDAQNQINKKNQKNGNMSSNPLSLAIGLQVLGSFIRAIVFITPMTQDFYSNQIVFLIFLLHE